MPKRLFFSAVVVLQIFSLLAVGAAKAYTLTTGQVVTLKTRPVDPRDMFRGDYVNLAYDGFAPQLAYTLESGRNLYLVLAKSTESPYWHVIKATYIKPQAAEHQIIIKGNVSGRSWFGWSGQRVEYGIERYYVPEGVGLALEKAKALSVQVAVDNFGNAVIKKVDIAQQE